MTDPASGTDPTSVIRAAEPEDASALSALALESKGHWGYSADFLEACRDELTYLPEQIRDDRFRFHVIDDPAGSPVALSVVERIDPLDPELSKAIAARDDAEPQTAPLAQDIFELEALFVAPRAIGRGLGRRLYQHARRVVRTLGGRRILIQSDPYAADFYQAMGARRLGERESGSLPGRFLPLFEDDLSKTT